jgi:hypothetical protein
VGDRKAAAAVYANQAQVQILRNAELEQQPPPGRATGAGGSGSDPMADRT